MKKTFPRFLLRALGLTLALGTAAWFVVGAASGPEARSVVPWAAGIAWLGLLLGRLVGLLVPSGRPESAAQAALVGMSVRMLSTVALAWVAAKAGVTPLPAFALVLGTLYLALLVLEVVEAVAEVRVASGALPSPPGSASHGSASSSAASSGAGPRAGADA